MSKTREKYGLTWPIENDDLLIELWMIRKGDDWLKKNGRSLSFHYEEAKKILWPELDPHRWHNLCRDSILENKVCVLMGCGSSGKTNAAAWISLLDYFAFPKETCVLVCSTDVRGLKKRVWGEVTMLWEKAIQKFDYLPGNLLDSAIAITTESMEDLEYGERKSRDMRQGIFGIPCFPSGTLVDTPTGKRKIESLKIGDAVFNAFGSGVVFETHERTTSDLVRVHFSDGRKIDCTPEHPFFTERGWVNASCLETCDMVFSANEALHIMQQPNRKRIPKQKALQLSLSKLRARKELRSMREEFQTAEKKGREILQHNMRWNMGVSTHGVCGVGYKTMPSLWKNDEEGSPKQKVLLRILQDEDCKKSMPTVRKNVSFDIGVVEKETISFLQRTLQEEGCWKAECKKASYTNRRGDDCLEAVSKISCSSTHKNRAENIGREKSLVSAGHSVSKNKTSGGNRRWSSQHSIKENKRRSENKDSSGAWVERVEVLKQTGSGISSDCKKVHRVHNIAVTGHPSYSVNGLLVHNCVQGGKFVGLSKFIGVKQKRMRLVADEASAMNDSFLSSFSNLNKNEDFRAIVLGNPNDIHDPLGKAAEPLGGWTDEFLEPTKTRTWKTRFMNGLCVNLVGIDSPNHDFPADAPTKYKYLISKEKIDETLSFFSKDSVEYFSQCVGTMKIGTMARRILTRELCERFGAQTQAIWKNDKRTKVYFLDASYGGDRAVCGGAEFGEDVNGKIVISFYPQKIIPVVVGGENVEDQLAKFVKQDCEALGISPSNMGHDATGRGSLGTALARIWSAETNPIESGGVPSDRPVSLDLFTTDEATGQRRLKLCKEFYDRKVSEFWFCVRYAVEAGQIRDLPEDAMEELCARKWDILKNGLHSVEVKDGTRSKPGMKQRTGKSPDHGDCAAGVIEMARRKGFQISKLAMEDKKVFGKNWIEQDMKKSMNLQKDRQLQVV
jgi:hypothetical protein